jgi:hypothetical protein
VVGISASSSGPNFNHFILSKSPVFWVKMACGEALPHFHFGQRRFGRSCSGDLPMEEEKPCL